MNTTPALIAFSILIAACTAAHAQPAPAKNSSAAQASSRPADRLGRVTEMVRSKQYVAARKELEILVRDHPKYADGVHALARVSFLLGQRTAGEAYLARYHGLMEKQADYNAGAGLLELARLAADRGDAATALGWLDKIDQREPGHMLAAQVQRARIVAGQGDLEGARLILSSYKPDAPAARAHLLMEEAALMSEGGQLEEALALLAQGIGRYPRNPDLLYDYGSLMFDAGRLEQAEAIMRDVIALDPDYYEAYNTIGFTLVDRNVRLEEASELIAKALALAPEDAAVIDSMGWLQYRLGKLAESETHLRRAYELSEDPEIAVHLAEVLWQRGQKAEAEKMLRAVRAQHPKHAVLVQTLARLKIPL